MMTIDELTFTLLQNPETLAPDTPLIAEFSLPEMFPGFQGHFVDQPILPGFLHLQLALEVLRHSGRAIGPLIEVPVAKFHRPILPYTRVLLELWATPSSHLCGQLRTGDQVLSTFTLSFAADSSLQ